MDRLRVLRWGEIKRKLSPRRRHRQEIAESPIARAPPRYADKARNVKRVLKVHNVDDACGTWLCDFCTTVLLIVTDQSHTTPVLQETKDRCKWDQKWADLRNSANQGCHFCRMRYGKAERKFGLYHLETTTEYVYLGDAFTDTYEVYCEYREEGTIQSDDNSIKPQTFCLLERNEDTPVIKAISLVGDSSESPQAFGKAMEWLEDCVSNHDRCGQYEADGYIPTRLLDIGTDENSPIRMVEKSCVPPHSPYFTLSHCWAPEKDMLMLRVNNYADFQKSISYECLPQGFQDAVKLCREFGVRYLWIDSLCIIQKDEADWRWESVRMHKVYASGRCNIVLAGGYDDTQTSHTVRDGLALTPFAFEAGPEGGTRNFTYLVVDTQIWENNLTLTRLYGRGWCIQELVLAPRKLILGRDQLVWACPESIACESYPVPADIPVQSLLRDRTQKADILLLNSESGGQMKRCIYGSKDEMVNTEDKFWAWAYILADYSRAELSYPESDRLVAMYGVAQRLGISKDYVWGIPEWDIVRQLLWRRRQVHKKYTSFPTWSWASCPDTVTYYHFDGKRFNFHRERGVPDLCAVLQVPESSRLSEKTILHPLDRSLVLLGTLWFGVGAIYTATPVTELVSCAVVYELMMLMYFDDNLDPNRRDVVLAPMITEFSRVSDVAPWSVHGLILESTGNAKGQYIRIGEFQSYDMYDSNWKAGIALSYPENAPDDGYEATGHIDRWGNQHYRYRLI